MPSVEREGTAIAGSVDAEPPKTPRSTRATAVLDRTERRGDPHSRLELGAVALPVVHRERMAAPAVGARHREHGGRIEAAGDEDDAERAKRRRSAAAAARRVRALPRPPRGKRAMMSSSVLRALPASPCSAWIAAIASSASGAFADCGYFVTSCSCAASALR
jgi:hypothetical protein